jgi:hypothetical protein
MSDAAQRCNETKSTRQSANANTPIVKNMRQAGLRSVSPVTHQVPTVIASTASDTRLLALFLNDSPALKVIVEAEVSGRMLQTIPAADKHGAVMPADQRTSA